MNLEVLGVHPVPEAPDPCFLVELRLDGGSAEVLDLGGITQERAGLPGSDWQSPFEEQLLDESGQLVRALGPEERRAITGPGRVAFLFHLLRPDRPLLTAAGPLRLPPATPRPERLKFLRYPLF